MAPKICVLEILSTLARYSASDIFYSLQIFFFWVQLQVSKTILLQNIKTEKNWKIFFSFRRDSMYDFLTSIMGGYLNTKLEVFIISQSW